MPVTLEYALPDQTVKTNAVWALVCGLCSGPVGFGLAILASANSWAEGTKERVGFIALVGTLGAAVLFSCLIKQKLPTSASRRDHSFTTVGIAAPMVWGLIIFLYISWALSQMGT